MTWNEELFRVGIQDSLKRRHTCIQKYESHSESKKKDPAVLEREIHGYSCTMDPDDALVPSGLSE